MTTNGQPPPGASLRRAIGFAAQEVARLRVPREAISDESEAWRELVGCIVGGASRFEHALCVTDALYQAIPRPWELSAKDRAHALKNHIRRSSRKPQSRFPKVHASYLLRAMAEIYDRGASICGLVDGATSARKGREDLVDRVAGLGPKQASLFLLNLGRTDELAVLDRHILRYLVWIGLRNDDRPPSSIGQYELIEETFMSHAQALGHRVADLDLAVWITVREWRNSVH